MKHVDLQTALNTLSEAHGPKALADAFHATQRAVRRARAKAKEDVGPLASAVMEAIAIRDQMKADGVTGEDLNCGLEGVLRDLWPKPHGRTEPWRYKCERCCDYGYEYFDCPGDETCGRDTPHAKHDYVRPCYCAKGQTMLEKKTSTPDDSMTKASKSRKMKQWGR